MWYAHTTMSAAGETKKRITNRWQRGKRVLCQLMHWVVWPVPEHQGDDAQDYGTAIRSDRRSKEASLFCTQVPTRTCFSPLQHRLTYLFCHPAYQSGHPVRFYSCILQHCQWWEAEISTLGCASWARNVYCAGISKREKETAHSASHWFYHILFIN